MDYEEMKEVAKWNKCAVCGGDLVIRQNAQLNERVVSCGRDHSHQGYQRLMTPTEHYKSGTPMPIEIANQVQKQQRATHTSELVEEWKQIACVELKKDVQTGAPLTFDQTRALVEYAYRYGLDPFRGHVCLMYGEPYIELEGYLYYAKQSGRAYTYCSVPMSEQERRELGVSLDSYAWLCHLWVDGRRDPIVGQGIVTQDEVTEMSKKDPSQKRYPILANKPSIMAQKRAEWQAFKRGFPIEEKKDE